MSFFPTKAYRFVPFLFALLLTFSCSKDSDLLADYVNPGSLDGNLRRFVIDDAFLAPANASIQLNVLANDTFPKDADVQITGTTSPSYGSVSINEDHSLTYSSDEPVESTDTFTYTTEVVNEDNTISSETGTVTVTLTDEKLPDVIMGELKAFPGAEGFGKYATGGRGGRVIEVTNLNDSGSGSFRSAIEASGPRTIIFKVGGYITLKSTLQVKNGDLTIAGQSSPGDGITIRGDESYNSSLFVVNAENVIIRYIRLRRGPGIPGECCGDTFLLSPNANNVIIDHCSISWGTDENISGLDATNVTVQNTIISEGLYQATHSYTFEDGTIGHSKGSLFHGNSSNITFFSNLFAHNDGRNPRINCNDCPVELINNIMYNNQHFNIEMDSRGISGTIRANVINNLFKVGPTTKIERHEIHADSDQNLKIYLSGNIGWNRTSLTEEESIIVGIRSEPLSDSYFESAIAFNTPLLNSSSVMDASALESNVLEHIGSSISRDEIDKRVIQDVKNVSGKLINHPIDVGGWPDLESKNSYPDQDKDGIDDNWEVLNDLNPSSSEDANQDTNSDGYTNLEEFLHLLTI